MVNLSFLLLRGSFTLSPERQPRMRNLAVGFFSFANVVGYHLRPVHRVIVIATNWLHEIQCEYDSICVCHY